MNPRHVEIVAKLQQAFREILPPEIKVCAMLVDMTEPAPYQVFVARNVPTDLAKEIAGAFADGKPSVTAHIVEVANGEPS